MVLETLVAKDQHILDVMVVLVVALDLAEVVINQVVELRVKEILDLDLELVVEAARVMVVVLEMVVKALVTEVQVFNYQQFSKILLKQ
tara:strand:+ start:146 stop:409 length:264 start_codon:yes stop_codon:yes gene_type:complete